MGVTSRGGLYDPEIFMASSYKLEAINKETVSLGDKEGDINIDDVPGIDVWHLLANFNLAQIN